MLNIIDERDDFFVVDKPAGVAFHSDIHGDGFFSQVKKKLNRSQLFAVHRLDAVSSGLLLLAKNREAAQQLGRLFQSRSIEKFYCALSDKKPKKKQGTLKGTMIRARKGAWKLVRSLDRPAITQFFSTAVSPGIRLFLIKPLTGRTHQIRVALKSLGSPICGDPLYHQKIPHMSYDRTYLHAYALKFSLNQKQYHYICPPKFGALFTTNTFEEKIEQWANPWNLKWPTV